ncbi:hypothetical protein UFOVP1193_64 [uncultured Caudovirales phage]|jgi:hypothetical protein|uniref:Uncharacterized protein n=1 Tax=uncultured Caudovirales phage TaxID=2100421 RepID=A0A6J5R1A3_9CAUD|nr:hypothetical protein UFOVP1193_64 [uncultured Caudovirales phage]
MAITQTMTTSFKAELMLAVHDFRPTAQAGDSVFKLALYTSSATLDANTTAYTASNEVTGTNYTAGGGTLTNLGVTTSNTSASAGTGFTDFSDLTFSTATITARGALIYNSTPKANSNADTTLTNASVCALDFGSDKTSTAGDFTIIFPSATNTTAIIRIA